MLYKQVVCLFAQLRISRFFVGCSGCWFLGVAADCFAPCAMAALSSGAVLTFSHLPYDGLCPNDPRIEQSGCCLICLLVSYNHCQNLATSSYVVILLSNPLLRSPVTHGLEVLRVRRFCYWNRWLCTGRWFFFEGWGLLLAQPGLAWGNTGHNGGMGSCSKCIDHDRPEMDILVLVGAMNWWSKLSTFFIWNWKQYDDHFLGCFAKKTFDFSVCGFRWEPRHHSLQDALWYSLQHRDLLLWLLRMGLLFSMPSNKAYTKNLWPKEKTRLFKLIIRFDIIFLWDPLEMFENGNCICNPWAFLGFMCFFKSSQQIWLSVSQLAPTLQSLKVLIWD